jgi:hypothetical protein
MPRYAMAVTNKEKVAAVACMTVLVASATVCSAAPAPQKILAYTSASENVESVAEIEWLIDPDVATWVSFQDLRRQWQQERGAKASVAEMAMTHAYQNIVGMGPDVVPSILKQLRSEGDRPDHWFWALASITRDNPVPPHSRGKVREMAEAWLEWGRKNNYV